MFEVDLYRVVSVASVREDGRFEGDLADRNVPAPIAQPLATLAGTGTKVVENIIPAGVPGERRGMGIETEGLDAADRLTFRLKIQTGPGRAVPTTWRRSSEFDADSLARVFKNSPRSASFEQPLMADALVVVHLGASAGKALASSSSSMARAKSAAAPRDTVLDEAFRDALLDDLTDRAELFPNSLGLSHQGFEDDVGFALCVAEIATGDALRRLKLAVDAAIALFDPRGVPGEVDMDQVRAAGLEVDAFARRVGADQNSQRFLARVGVEGMFDLLPAVQARGAGEDADAVLGEIGVFESLPKATLQPAARVLIFGENYEPAVVPDRPQTSYLLSSASAI